MELGKLSVEYNDGVNLIQISNSTTVCSLVINNEVVDHYDGIVATRFVLKGSVKKNEKEIEVTAKMGFLFMKLFYDNKCVNKKFMGFG